MSQQEKQVSVHSWSMSKSPRQYLIVFLRSLEVLLQPPPSCHHAMTYAQYGSTELGWEDRLAVQLNDNGVFRCVFLDEDDMRLSPTKLAERVAEFCKAPPSRFEQKGAGPGRYADLQQ